MYGINHLGIESQNTKNMMNTATYSKLFSID